MVLEYYWPDLICLGAMLVVGLAILVTLLVLKFRRTRKRAHLALAMVFLFATAVMAASVYILYEANEEWRDQVTLVYDVSLHSNSTGVDRVIVPIVDSPDLQKTLEASGGILDMGLVETDHGLGLAINFTHEGQVKAYYRTNRQIGWTNLTMPSKEVSRHRTYYWTFYDSSDSTPDNCRMVLGYTRAYYRGGSTWHFGGLLDAGWNDYLFLESFIE